MLLKGMSQGHSKVHRVAIATTIPVLHKDAVLREFRKDSLDRPLGDPHLIRDLPRRHEGVLLQAHQDVRVVREKRPLGSVTPTPIPFTGLNIGHLFRVLYLMI